MKSIELPEARENQCRKVTIGIGVVSVSLRWCNEFSDQSQSRASKTEENTLSLNFNDLSYQLRCCEVTICNNHQTVNIDGKSA